MNRVWAPLLVHALAIVACGEIVGIHDVPIPIDAAPPPDGSVVDGTALDSSEEIHDAVTPDTFEADGSLADVASGPGDAALDTATSEAAAVDASIEAAVDAAACAPTWNTVSAACNGCGIMSCCAQLGICQAIDDSGLSRCRAFVSCVTGYTGTNPPGTGDANCKNDEKLSTSEFALGEATLSCIRAACPTDCNGL